MVLCKERKSNLFSFEVLVYLVLEEIKPHAAAKEAAKRSEVTDQTKKMEKKRSAEAKPGILIFLKNPQQDGCAFLCVPVVLHVT